MTPLPFHFRAAFAGVLLVALSACGDKPASSSSSGGKANQASSSETKKDFGREEGRKPASGTDGTGEGRVGAKEGKPLSDRVASVLLPEGSPTGSLPPEWQGRSAQAEEERLRASGEWEARRAAFFEQWGKADPVAAIVASRKTDRGAITAATGAAVAGWAAADLPAAMAWVKGQPANAEHAAFTAAVIRVGNPGAPGGAGYDVIAEWLGGQANLPSLQPTVRKFVLDWSGSDREKAVEWASTGVPEEPARAVIFGEVMRSAVGADNEGFAKTGEWLEKRPPGALRDELLVAFVGEAARHDPAASSKWAALISDGILRQRALKICREAGATGQ